MDSRLSAAELRQKPLVEERLKAIAAQLIDAHRRQDHSLVVPYARQAGLAVEGQSAQRLFMRTIQVFHPDRLSVVWARVEGALAAGDARSLEAIAQLLEFRPRGSQPIRAAEAYRADPEEYGFEPSDEADWWESGDDEEDPGTFYYAVKRALFGNLVVYPDPAMLNTLEGELDLSDWDIHDLDGIEHCQSLTSLNLSHNAIDNVYPLKDLLKLESLDLSENDLEDADWLAELSNLKELDLSANDIDDVAFLDRMPSLRYVDLTGNPVRNKAVVARLEARGVVVIW